MNFKLHYDYDHNPCRPYQVRDENNGVIDAHLTEHEAVLLAYHLNKGYRTGWFTVDISLEEADEFVVITPDRKSVSMDGEYIAAFLFRDEAEKIAAILNAMPVNKDKP